MDRLYIYYDCAIIFASFKSFHKFCTRTKRWSRNWMLGLIINVVNDWSLVLFVAVVGDDNTLLPLLLLLISFDDWMVCKCCLLFDAWYTKCFENSYEFSILKIRCIRHVSPHLHENSESENKSNESCEEGIVWGEKVGNENSAYRIYTKRKNTETIKPQTNCKKGTRWIIYGTERSEWWVRVVTTTQLTIESHRNNIPQCVDAIHHGDNVWHHYSTVVRTILWHDTDRYDIP